MTDAAIAIPDPLHTYAELLATDDFAAAGRLFWQADTDLMGGPSAHLLQGLNED